LARCAGIDHRDVLTFEVLKRKEFTAETLRAQRVVELACGAFVPDRLASIY